MSLNQVNHRNINSVDDIKDGLIDIFNKPFDIPLGETEAEVPISDFETLKMDSKLIEALNENVETDEDFIRTYRNLANQYQKLHYFFFYRMKQLFEDISLDQLDDEAKEFCKSSKWLKGRFKFTPFGICDNIFSQVEDSIRTKNFPEAVTINTYNKYTYLNLYDFSLYYYQVFYKEIDPKQIYVVSDSQIDKYIIKMLGCPADHLFDSVEDLKENCKMKHFDYAIGNPPYIKNMDLTILNEVRKISNEVCLIHPSSFLLKNRERKSDVYRRHINSNSLEKLILMWGNEIFNIGLFMPLCISYWNNEHNSSNVEIYDNAFSKCKYNIDIKDISIFGKNVNFKNEISNIIEKYKDNNFNNHMLHYPDKATDYSISISVVRGHIASYGFNDDFFTLLGKDQRKTNYVDSSFQWKDPKASHGMQCQVFSFNSEDERKKFVEFCKTKICRMLFAYNKNNANTYVMCDIPWLDFTKDWNDKKLCKEFNISNELWQYIDKFIPDYYEDYKSGF